MARSCMLIVILSEAKNPREAGSLNNRFAEILRLRLRMTRWEWGW